MQSKPDEEEQSELDPHKLQSQLDECRRVMEEQAQLVQYVLKIAPHAVSSTTSSPYALSSDPSSPTSNPTQEDNAFSGTLPLLNLFMLT